MDHEPAQMEGDCFSAYENGGMEPSSMPMRYHHGWRMMDRNWEAQQ